MTLRSRTRGISPVASGLAVTAVGGYAAITVWALARLSYDVSGAFLIGPLLVLVSVPLLKRVADGAPELTLRLLLMALVAKLLSSLVRYAQLYVLYDGVADSARYDEGGRLIAVALRNGLEWEASGPFPGTAFIEGLTGYVYVLLGSTLIGAFFFFSWLGFWGLLLFQRAVATALPDADVRRYAQLVLFLPSLLFWPSSIGKEAWMTLVLGLGAYGAARVFARRRGGVIVLALGLGGASLVRPHMAALLFGGLFVGYLARPSRPDSAFGPLLKTVGTAVLVVVGVLLVAQAERFFGVEDAGGNSLDAVLEQTNDQTSQGGSSFDAEPVSSPLQLPGAFVSVLFRPFLWEARNVQALVAALESTALLYLAWRSRSRLRSLPRLLKTRPYVAFAVSYSIGFVIAFSSFANFGILTRQRVQVFPFVLVLLALPVARALPQGAASAASSKTRRRAGPVDTVAR